MLKNLKIKGGSRENETKEIRIVYLSGPMSLKPEHNFPAFEAAAKDLRFRGFKVISPHENDNGNTDKSWLYYMKMDIKSVADSDMIVVLPGWEKSKGANVEVNLGRSLGYSILKYPDLTPVNFDSPEELPHEEAIRIVNGNRNENYGPPDKDFSRSAMIWTALLSDKLKEGCVLDAENVGWMMLGIKMSRQVNKKQRDNLTDSFGYLLCLEKIQAKNKEQEENLYPPIGDYEITKEQLKSMNNPESLI
jgi:hypothetical protein